MLKEANAMTALYQIRLRGHLDRRHDEWLEGFSTTHHPDGETILTGWVPDQAALYGVLLRIRDVGIPLLSLNQLDPELAGVKSDLTPGQQVEE
jgi:hypothetical protein